MGLALYDDDDDDHRGDRILRNVEAHSVGATKRLQRIEIALWVIAVAMAVIVGRQLGLGG